MVLTRVERETPWVELSRNPEGTNRPKPPGGVRETSFPEKDRERLQRKTQRRLKRISATKDRISK